MNNIEHIKNKLKLDFDEAVNWVYGEYGTDTGDASSELEDHMLPIINKAIEDAGHLNKESI